MDFDYMVASGYSIQLEPSQIWGLHTSKSLIKIFLCVSCDHVSNFGINSSSSLMIHVKHIFQKTLSSAT